MIARARITLVRLGLLAAFAAPLSGCFSHYSDGPKFVPVDVGHTPEGHGLVYVYRPTRSVGAGWFFPVVWRSRRFSLVSGSYGVFVVPEGKQSFTGGPQLFGSRAGQTRGDFTVDVKRDKPVFVRISFGSLDAPQSTEIVSTEEGLREISSLYLGAGGAARTPIPEYTPAE